MLPKFECAICSPDIEFHYDTTLAITEKNQKMLNISLGHPHGSKILSGGRVVVLRDAVRVLSISCGINSRKPNNFPSISATITLLLF